MTNPAHSRASNKSGRSSVTTDASVIGKAKPKSVIRVLIIEDNETETLLIQKMLSPTADTTFDLQFVDCVEAGIQQFERTLFDVVLLDLNLPGSTGLHSFLRVYARYPEVPIVILTGINQQQTVAETLRKGAQDYLFKGDFNKSTLLRSIQYAIERNRRQQAERIVLQSHLEERRRLARELHDGVIQSLSAIRLNLQVLENELAQQGDARSSAAIREIANEAHTAIQDVRLFSNDLHPSELDKHKFSEAIESYGQQLAKQYELTVEVTNECTQTPRPHVKNHLYRIVQESMRNAAKHAGATCLRVNIRQQDFFIIAEVHDDGIGFEEPKNGSSTTGLGLISIRERTRMLGGTARIQSKPGAGTSVLVEIPF